MAMIKKSKIKNVFCRSIGRINLIAVAIMLLCYFLLSWSINQHHLSNNEQPQLCSPVADQLSHDYAIVVSKTDPSIAVSVYKKGDIVSNNIMKHGYWDGGLTAIVSAILDAQQKPSGPNTQPQTIVDFGANVGWFSLLAASKGHQSIAIEPMLSNRGALFQSIALNCFENSIQVVAAALGDGSPDSPSTLCIQPRVAGHNIGNGQTTTNIDDCGEVVPMRTLGSIIGNRNVDFVKADCEGCEANAIMGMKDIITGKGPPCSFSIEWRSDNIKELGGNPMVVAELLLRSGYLFFRQQCNLVTGEGLKLTEVPSSTVLEVIPSSSMDLILLHDSKRCFERNGKPFQFVMDRVALFQPKL